VGGLGDDELAGLEERRRKWRTRAASTLDEFHHRGNAALAGPARHVDIVGARLLQRQADELAAALDRRPVIELVAHGEAVPCWLVMRGQKRVKDARERAYDPRIHLLSKKIDPRNRFTRFRALQVRKSDKSDLHCQARG